MPDVRLPDGRIITNVPDGTTQEQLMQRVASFDQNTQGQAPVIPVEEEVAPETPGLFTRIGEDLSQRKEALVDIIQGVPQEFSIGEALKSPERGLQITGQVAGGIGDIAGQTLISGLRTTGNVISAITPDIIEEPIKDITSNIGERIVESPPGKLGLKALSKGVEQYGNFKAENPRAAQNLESVFNIGALLGVPKVKPAIKPTKLGKFGQALTETAEKITPDRAKSFSADDIRRLASEKYTEARKLGGVLKPERVNKFLDDVKKIQPQTEAARLVAGRDDIVTQTIKRLDELRNRSLSLDELQEIDELLGESIDDLIELGRPTKRGRKLIQVQDKLRKTIDEANADDLISNQGFDALKEGRALWSRAAKLRDIERIITRAELTDAPSSSIKSGLRTILSNPNKARGFTKAELKEMRKAAKTGDAEELLRLVGSRLVSIGTFVATGEPVTATLVAGASKLARKGAEGLKQRKVKKLQELIISGGKPKEIPFTGKVGNALKSFSSLTTDNLGKTLKAIDRLIATTTDNSLVKSLRLDREAIIDALQTFGEREIEVDES